MKQTHIVTRESLIRMLQDEAKRSHVIGRALVVLFNRQNEDEKSSNTTNVHNMRGFAGADAKSGTITAKYYLKHKTLLAWQVEAWMRTGSSGMPRITKYWKQLDQAAQLRAAREVKPTREPMDPDRGY